MILRCFFRLLFVRAFLRWYPRENSPTIALSAIRYDWIYTFLHENFKT
jgi:hypothetical protein